MKTQYFSRKKRQFENLARRINELIKSNEWERLSVETRNKIILKLKTLYKQLSHYFSQPELRKILAAAALFIGFPLAAQSQSFAPPQLNPFGLAPEIIQMAIPAFADIDNDGDFDLFTGIYGGSILFYENTGTNSSPAFSLPQLNPFGIIPPLSYVVFPAFADIDLDGDLDLLLGSSYADRDYNANFYFFENTGTPTEPSFSAAQINPFGLSPAYFFAIPEFADIDGDGDLDLFAGEGYGNMKFYENTGTETLPAFATPLQNPFGLTPINNIGSPAFSDIDHDGDLDLFVGEYYGNFMYFQNTGTATTPAFAFPLINPFGLTATNYYNFPAIADLDDDGDDDIMVGEYYGMFQYFENTEITIGIAENQGYEFFSLFPNPATEEVFINLKDELQSQNLEVIITDLHGRVIQKEIMKTDDLRLKTEDLSPGLYFVRLTRNDQVYTRKLIIK